MQLSGALENILLTSVFLQFYAVCRPHRFGVFLSKLLSHLLLVVATGFDLSRIESGSHHRACTAAAFEGDHASVCFFGSGQRESV